MPVFSYEQLTEGLTQDEAKEELLQLLKDQGIDTTSWKEGDPSQNWLQLQSYIYSELSKKIVDYVNYSFNQTASGSGLTILSDSYFDNQRILSQRTKGNIILNAVLPTAYNTWQPTELQVTDGTFTFENLNQITLNAAQPYVTASFQSTESSADYNIASDSQLTTVDTILGLSVSNPPNPSSDTWITAQGVDEEPDSVLRNRNALKWTTLQASELTTDRVKALALSGSSNIYFVSVDDTNPRGARTVDVYLSRQFTTGSTADVELVQTKFDNVFFGNGVSSSVTFHDVSASLAAQVAFSSSVTIYRTADSNLSTVQTAVENAITNWIGTIPIGGFDYVPVSTLKNVARKNDLIKILESLEGVESIQLSPDTDWTFQPNEKLTKPTSYANLITYVKLNK